MATGGEVRILFPGIWNLDAGPDFLGAELEMDGLCVKGDVEIHVRTSDWARHGHENDNRYDGVVLHVVATDDTDSAPPSLKPHLPDIPLAIAGPAGKLPRKSNQFPSGTCQPIFSSMSDQELRALFTEAGRARFHIKSGAALTMIREHGVEHATRLLIFDAFGYQRNRKAFQTVCHRLRAREWTNPREMEAAIWGESGLLPDPAALDLAPEMEKFTTEIWKQWWKIRETASPTIKWHRAGTRPMNSPERRLAALTVVIERMHGTPMATMIELAGNSRSPKELIENLTAIFTVHHPLWDGWTNFTAAVKRPASVLGATTAAEIAVNVALPAIKAYASLANPDNDNNELALLAEHAFEAAPPLQQNRITRTAALKWLAAPAIMNHVIQDAASQQGVIHVHKRYCEPAGQNCADCALPLLIDGHAEKSGDT